MSDSLQQHLDKSMYGAPKINPEEQAKYLGTFRERCLLSMTKSEMQNPKLQTTLKNHLAEFKGYKALLNAKLPESLQATYITILSQAQIPFTVTESSQPCSEDSIGLLIVDSQAVNEAIIDIAEKYPSNTKEPTQKKHESFWHKLFS